MDRELNRVMAMKIMHPELAAEPAHEARFVEEAQATAQLQHPGIVPVHELGTLADGRRYFTMKEVRGTTLKHVIVDVHRGRGEWSFRRLIAAFHDVCEAVAFAHSRGVIHRDLKPANIMVGDFGEVLVMDWGLAKVLGSRYDGPPPEEPVVTDRSQDRAQATRIGVVAGTPTYMAPEQARGQVQRLAPPSDVYSLGAILYAILAGRPPYKAETGAEIVEMVRAGPPAPLAPTVDRELAAICDKAMQRDMDDRYPDAVAMARELEAWLDGVRRQEQALIVVAEAEQHLPRIEELRVEAGSLRDDAEGMLAEVRPWDPEGAKRRAWRLEDQATALEREAELLEIRVQRALYGALNIAPTLLDAHEALASRYREEHAVAEAERDQHRATRAEEHLKAHALALAEHSPTRRGHLAYLEGRGRVTVLTEPASADIRLLAYELHNRKLEATLKDFFGPGPLVEHSLAMGSWCIELAYEGRARVRYPVFLGRQESWDGVPPLGEDPLRIVLPRAELLEEDDRYVPAGWFWSGGDAEALSGLPRRRIWVDAFFIKQTPITQRQFIAFLDALVDAGRGEEAERHAPHQDGVLMYGRDQEGHFHLKPDSEGDLWQEDWPVFLVDWEAAQAYAAWWSQLTGFEWRLPMELEWEKAGRGVDGRHFPWGDQLDPSWCCMRDSHQGQPMPAPVESYRVDTSPYGVADMAGNMRQWCQDLFDPMGPEVVDGRAVVARREGSGRRSVRGGRFSGTANNCRLADRSANRPNQRLYVIGFRLARSL